MLLAALQRHEAGMRKCLMRPDAIPAKSYVAFVSLTYNIGVGAFAGRQRASVSTPGMCAGLVTQPSGLTRQAAGRSGDL